MQTKRSLLQQAKQGSDSEAWFQIIQIYDPLISGWIARAGVEGHEINDLTQEVLTVLSQELVNFEHNGRTGAFRNWLKLIAINRCRRYWDAKRKRVSTIDLGSVGDRGIELLDELEDPKSDASLLWEAEHDKYVFEKVVDLIRKEFDPQIFDVFLRNTMKDESVQSISEDLEISANAIYKIKFRVMKRLKEAAEGLLEEVHSAN